MVFMKRKQKQTEQTEKTEGTEQTEKAEGTQKTEQVEKAEQTKQAEKAFEILKDEKYLREIYDYNLRVLIHAIEKELGKRSLKKECMIGSVEDMHMFMKEHNETHSTFYYKPMSPKELMNDSYIDDVTDEGHSKISQQLGTDGRKSFVFGNKNLVVMMYPEGEASGRCRYEVDLIEIGETS